MEDKEDYKAKENMLRFAGTPFERAGHKPQRYTLQSEEEMGKLSQLAQKMYTLGIIDEPKKRIAFKVLAEIVLTTDVIGMEELEMFKKKQE